MLLSHRTADELNRIGLVVGFLSFWFAAPEFIGEQRLKSWEQILASGLSRVPKIVRAATSFVMYFFFLLFYVQPSLVSTQWRLDRSVAQSCFRAWTPSDHLEHSEWCISDGARSGKIGKRCSH